MHRHRRVWLTVQRSCIHSRTAATAAKPRGLPDLDAGPTTPSKWALSRHPVSPSKWAFDPPQRKGNQTPAEFPPLGGQRKEGRARHSPSRTSLRSHSEPRNSSGFHQPHQNRTWSQNPPGVSQRTAPSHISPEPVASNISRPRYIQSPVESPLPEDRHEEQQGHGHSRAGRSSRLHHKDRGSLLSRQVEGLMETPPFSQRQHKVKRGKIIEKKVTPDVFIPSTISVGTLARLLGVRLESLQLRMRQVGMAEEAVYDHVLTSDYATLLVEEFGRNPIVNDEAAFDIYPPPPHPDPSSLESRPPVVTIMGHVDHGKTTLLDSLRSSSVAKGEAGGITQHIGAFSVTVPSASGFPEGKRSITFLDTPGHAAFSAMRARGARVTDIIVLVVAADDGIMPQTKEVIDLIKKDEGKIGVVVAINKVDKPDADVEAVQTALFSENVHLETLGGDVPSIEVSGLTGHGLPMLVETVSAMAEMLDLRAERDGPMQGYILESKVHKGLGPVATVLLLRGSLKAGSHLISGLAFAKVKVMSNSTGAVVKVAYPGMAVTVSGWRTLPNAGDEVLQGTEGEVKKASINRQRKAEIDATLADVEVINANRRLEKERRELELSKGDKAAHPLPQEEQSPKELRLVIKADVSGSAEAVEGALQGIGNKEAFVRIISSGVGDITESDIMHAKAIGGMVVGFSVNTPKVIQALAAQSDVPIASSNVIYRLMDDIKNRIIALLPVITETKVTGEATVLQLFDIQIKRKQTKKVAGCRATNGIVEKNKYARLVRDGVTIHDGLLDTMRILKKDVTEVRKGTECGLCFGTAFSDIREGDIIQVYEKIEKPGIL